MPHHQSVLNALDESKSKLIQEAVVKSGNTAAAGRKHQTKKTSASSSLSEAVSMTEALLSVIDDQCPAYF